MLHLHNGEELHEWSDEEVRVDWQMPPLGMQQAVHTLRALGVRVVGCEQEADALIVVEARRVRAFAVLGRDSDFFVFTGARYVPIDFLSFDGEDCIRIVDASAMEPPEHAMRDRLVQAVKAQGGTIARTQVGQVYAKEKKAMDRFESLPTKFSKFLEQSCAGFLESTSIDGEDCIRIVDASAMEPPEHAMRDRLVQAVKAQGGTIARTQVGQVYAKEKKAMDRFESLPTKFSKFLEQSCAGFLESTSIDGKDCIRIVDASARSTATSTPQQVDGRKARPPAPPHPRKRGGHAWAARRE